MVDIDSQPTDSAILPGALPACMFSRYAVSKLYEYPAKDIRGLCRTPPHR